ncbi:MAG: helix-turn-helix domain-containing protein [Acidobacteriaceae bacterium]
MEQLKAIFAAEIIKMLDREGLGLVVDYARTGIPAADFSPIRNANFGRFILDGLVQVARPNATLPGRLWIIYFPLQIALK